MIDHCARADLLIRQYMVLPRPKELSVSDTMINIAKTLGFGDDLVSIDLALMSLYEYVFGADAVIPSRDMAGASNQEDRLSWR